MTRLGTSAATALRRHTSYLLISSVSILLASMMPPVSAFGQASNQTAAADRALQQGRADDAVHLLQRTLSGQPDNTTAHLLLCRVFYAEEDASAAVPECERAAALTPDDSMTQMWLGRAYGLKAENAGPFSGLSLAKKVRVAFERAVQLNPANVPAATALGQFYIAAPSLIGGGIDKAQRVASQLQQYSPSAAHRLLAMSAEKQKDIPRAETEFKAAVATGRSADAWVDLGNFYERQNQPDQAVSALRSAIELDRDHGPASMDIASILTDAHRSPDIAEKVLRQYLASSAKSEEAPAFKVHYQLGRLLAQRGDTAGAQREYTAALSLASGYAPARTALQRP